MPGRPTRWPGEPLPRGLPGVRGAISWLVGWGAVRPFNEITTGKVASATASSVLITVG